MRFWRPPKAKDPADSKVLWWAIPLLLVLVLIVVAFSTLGWGTLGQRLAVDLEQPRYSEISDPQMPVTGQVNRSAQVDLVVNGMPIGRTTATSGFRFDQVRLDPGLNRIQARAHSVTGWPEMEATREIDVYLLPDPPTPPRLYSPDAPVTAAKTTVRGIADPGAEVRLNVNGMETPWVSAEQNGFFRSEVPLSEPGPYTVTAIARNEKGTMSATSAEITFLFDPSWTPPRRQRQLTGTLSYGNLQLTASVTIWKEDPAASALLDGRLKFSDFIDREFMGLAVNQEPIAYAFQGVAPHIAMSGNVVTILATSKSQRFPLGPFGSLSLTSRTPFPLEDDDVLTLTVTDYRVVGQPLPRPTLRSDQVATWRGPYGAAQEGGIKLDLEPETINPGLLAFSPYDFLPYPATQGISLVYAILFAIPMLWTAKLLGGKADQGADTDPIIQKQASVARRLAALAFLAPFVSVASGLTYLTRRGRVLDLLGLRLSDSDAFDLSGVALTTFWLLILALVSLVLYRLSGWVRQSQPAILGIVLKAWVEAALLGAATEFLLLALRVTVAQNDYQVLAWLCVLPLVFWVGFWGTRLLRLAPISRRLHLLIILVAVIASLGLSYPISSNYFGDTSGLGTAQLASGDVQSFLYLIRAFLPYLLVLGLVVIASKAGDQAAVNPLVFGIGSILFAAFVVGTVSIFLIPLPLLLAIWLLPRAVLSPVEERTKISQLVPRLIGQRPTLLSDNPTISRVVKAMTALEALDKKLAAGDLSPSAYERRRRELDKYIAKHTSPKLTGLLTTKNLALAAGPFVANSKNAMRGLGIGLGIATPWVVLTILLAFDASTTNPYLPLSLVAQLLVSLAEWAVAGYFFGYFFPYIRGQSGLQKGLRVGLVVIACLLPLWAFSALTPGSNVFRPVASALETIFFFTLLGWVFDYTSYRHATGGSFSWQRFFRFGDMTSLTAAWSVVIASVGAAVTSVLTGQLGAVAGLLLKAAVGQPPGGPPPTP